MLVKIDTRIQENKFSNQIRYSAFMQACTNGNRVVNPPAKLVGAILKVTNVQIGEGVNGEFAIIELEEVEPHTSDPNGKDW